MSKYEISVITPYHNVSKEVFLSAVDSMKKQTLGFEKIEWVIVMHNCEEQYITDVKAMLGDYENVLIEILNNDVHSPSSPRNYGMKLATSDYIGYLDADDSYTPAGLEQAVKHMKKSGAQVTWFRREFEMEDSGNMPVTELVMWDQTQEEIIIEKGINWDEDKLFSGLWGLVTNRIYDRKFLADNDLWFDESVPFAEDYTFNVEVYGHAKKLCYLPQLIGYHYYINNDSLVQKQDKSPEKIKDITRGFVKLFSAILKYGFYADPTIGAMLICEIRFMKGCPELTYEDRVEIKNMLQPYLDIMKPLRLCKLYSEKTIQDRWALRDYVLYPERFVEGKENDVMLPSGDYQNDDTREDIKLLMQILDENHGNDYGNRYGFLNINTLSGFQSKIPTSNYDVYQPMIALNIGIGESGIFVKEPIVNYVYSFGKYGNKKIIPCTKSHLDSYVRLLAPVFEQQDTFLLYESISKPRRFNDNTTINSIFDACMQNYYGSEYYARANETAKFAIPSSMLFDEEHATSKYYRVLYALADENVTQIVAPNTWNVLRMLEIITNEKDRLCNDIENGITESKGLAANPARAAYLRSVFSQADARIDLKKLWPNMTRIVAYTGGEFSIYTAQLRKMFSDIQIENAPYFIPEAAIGKVVSGLDEYAFNLDGAFYEFCKAEDYDNPEKNLLLIDDLEVEENYWVFVTNRSGLYRYDTKVCVTITGMKEQLPLFKINYDIDSQVVSGDGSIYSSKVYTIISTMDEPYASMIDDYAIAEEEDQAIIYIQSVQENIEHKEEITAILVDKLNETGVNGAIQVRFIEPETMLLYAETKAEVLNVTNDTIYPAHFLRTPRSQRFFRARQL